MSASSQWYARPAKPVEEHLRDSEQLSNPSYSMGPNESWCSMCSIVIKCGHCLFPFLLMSQVSCLASFPISPLVHSQVPRAVLLS